MSIILDPKDYWVSIRQFLDYQGFLNILSTYALNISRLII